MKASQVCTVHVAEQGYLASGGTRSSYAIRCPRIAGTCVVCGACRIPLTLSCLPGPYAKPKTTDTGVGFRLRVPQRVGAVKVL